MNNFYQIPFTSRLFASVNYAYSRGRAQSVRAFASHAEG